jgi:hypothetical protein
MSNIPVIPVLPGFQPVPTSKFNGVQRGGKEDLPGLGSIRYLVEKKDIFESA